MVKAAFAKTSPIAFMRGLTFPGGQQPVIRGEGVYLRYPRIADFPVWAKPCKTVLLLAAGTPIG